MKPRHILNAVVSPCHAIKAFKYHYRRVSERDFVYFLGKQLDQEDDHISSAYTGLKNNNPLWSEIKNRLSAYQNSYGLQMTKELPVLYLLTRLLKPSLILETGVASGASSAYILQALNDNEKGELYSIDLPPDNLPPGETSGWLVPEYLRSRWKLHIGNSKDLLKPILSEIEEIDCFIHDSLHTYDHMMWEFKTVWNYLRNGGLFLSHDVGANEAFFDFMNSEKIPWRSYRVFHVLGGFVRLKS